MGHGMLQEIYQWFLENLKDRKPASPPRAESETAIAPPNSAPTLQESRLTFQVYAEVLDDGEPGLLCPKASFHPEWLEGNHSQGPMLFQCCCKQNNALQEVGEDHLQLSCEVALFYADEVM